MAVGSVFECDDELGDSNDIFDCFKIVKPKLSFYLFSVPFQIYSLLSSFASLTDVHPFTKVKMV